MRFTFASVVGTIVKRIVRTHLAFIIVQNITLLAITIAIISQLLVITTLGGISRKGQRSRDGEKNEIFLHFVFDRQIFINYYY
jgi:hypothetical protein